MKKNILDKLDIYKLKTSEELLKYYQDWADNNKYNKDMVDWNYTAPQEVVSILKKYALNKNFKILDAGCGTGLVGIELKKYGYSNIEGVDFSQNMLDLVPRSIYKKIEKIDILKKSVSINSLKDKINENKSFINFKEKIENNIIKVLLFSDLSQITFININLEILDKGK